MYKFNIVLVFIAFTSIMLISCNRHIAQQKEKKYYYTCPMHTEVFEMKPGKCPKCSMALEQYDMENYSQKRTSSSHSGHSSSSSSGCH